MNFFLSFEEEKDVEKDYGWYKIVISPKKVPWCMSFFFAFPLFSWFWKISEIFELCEAAGILKIISYARSIDLFLMGRDSVSLFYSFGTARKHPSIDGLAVPKELFYRFCSAVWRRQEDLLMLSDKRLVMSNKLIQRMLNSNLLSPRFLHRHVIFISTVRLLPFASCPFFRELSY